MANRGTDWGTAGLSVPDSRAHPIQSTTEVTGTAVGLDDGLADVLTPPTAAVPAPTVNVPNPPAALSFPRPFEPAFEVRGSAFFPYGTDANGQYLMHHGIDIGNPTGTPVLAVGAGTVVYGGGDQDSVFGPTTDFYGSLVVIRHGVQRGSSLPSDDADSGLVLYSLYGHLSETEVVAGDEVRAGAVVGRVGSTGVALGPHLHLEFRTSPRDYRATVNPALYLKPLDGTGIVVGRLVGSNGRLVPDAPVSLFRMPDGTSDGTSEWAASTVTYPADPVNSSEGWDENFVFADLPVGTYAVTPSGRNVLPGDVFTVTAYEATRVTLTR